jgi:hypothetical protein
LCINIIVFPDNVETVKRRRAPPAQLDIQGQGAAAAKKRMVTDRNRPRVLSGITTQETTSEMTLVKLFPY